MGERGGNIARRHRVGGAATKVRAIPVNTDPRVVGPEMWVMTAARLWKGLKSKEERIRMYPESNLAIVSHQPLVASIM
jgi:hypothetical protein